MEKQTCSGVLHISSLCDTQHVHLRRNVRVLWFTASVNLHCKAVIVDDNQTEESEIKLRFLKRRGRNSIDSATVILSR